MLRTSVAALAAVLPWTAAEAQGEPDTAANGEVTLAYWSHGPADGVPIVVINGQGAATRPGDGLALALAARGFRVILFDNRDSGRSTALRGAGAPPEMDAVFAALAAGGPAPVAYDLFDMAQDTVAVLDAAGVERAHVLGHSLGGMIAQVLAAEHPDRVLSLISVSSTSGDPDLPFGPAMAALSGAEGEGPGTPAEQQARIYRIFEGGASLRMTDDEVASRVAADMAADDPHAAARQMTAAIATGDRRALMRRISAPALVIHGRDDPWFPLAHAESTAAALPHARLELVGGMGHIIPDAAAATVAGLVAEFVQRP